MTGNEPIFQKAFRTAELASLTREQYEAYEQNLLDYWGVKAAVDTARDEGRQEGAEQRTLDMARKMLAKGYELTEIAELTGLALERLASLKQSMIEAGS